MFEYLEIEENIKTIKVKSNLVEVKQHQLI